MRVKKTRQSDRGVYRYPVQVEDGRGGYRTVYNVIKPGEDGITEVMIKSLHAMDDHEVYPLYRKVKCGTCGRAMSYRTYSRNGVTYRYFTCPHTKEQTEEDGCCKRYVTEDNLNEIVWSVIRQLLDMTDAFKKKLDKQNSISRQDNLLLAEKLAKLQQEKEKCESDRFANVDQFMAGQLDKEVYQRRRADLGRLAERLNADIAELEQKLKAAETAKDDSLSQVLGVMKKYSKADELTQAMVQELIDKVIVKDPEHVEIVWRFKDEVRKFIGM